VSTERRPPRKIRRRGFKHRIPFYGLIFLFILIVLIPSYYTSRDTFCGSCHIMKPYYSTWTKSTHARVSCVSCHNGSGPIGWVASKSALFRQIVVAIVFRPDKIKEDGNIPNSYCIECHAEHRTITSGADLKLPAAHHKMQNNPFQCVDCHKALVHSATPNGKNTVKMKICVDCHKAKKISVKCVICHNEKNKQNPK
jgi:nitrate/TMAO reductase-like tetraheme cytochrome c subunit